MKLPPKTASNSNLRQHNRTQTRPGKQASARQERRHQHENVSSGSDSSHYSDARESFSSIPAQRDEASPSPQPSARYMRVDLQNSNATRSRPSQQSITVDQRLDHENLVQDKKNIDSLAKKAKRIIFAKPSRFKKEQVDPQIHTATVTTSTNAAIMKLRAEVTQRWSGITKVEVSGMLILNGKDSEHLARIVGRESIPVTAITPTRLRQLHEEGNLGTTMTPFLDPKAVSMFLENDQAVRTHLSASASSRQPIRLRQFAHSSSIYELQKKRNLHETGLTSVACALACSCLRHNEYDLFAEIIAVAPRRLMQQITVFPFEGNIFSPNAILALLRRLSPDNSREMLQSERGQMASEAISLALNHYFKFAPVKGLRRHIPRALSLQRKGGQNCDLLIQNHLKFAAEVAFLGEQLLHAPNLSDPATLLQASQVGGQLALLVGNSFQYAVGFCEGLKKDKKALLSKVGTGVEIAKIALGAVVTVVPATEGASAGAALGATKIGDIIARWATEPSQEMNIPKMAAQLARLSDAYIDRSRDALLVPGTAEIDSMKMREMERSNSMEVINARENRKQAATAFNRNYKSHLANFKKRYLESSLTDVAP